MEIAKIEETKQATLGPEIRLRRLKGRAGIYYPDIICSAPKLQFRICRACPYAGQFIRQNVIRSIFEYVKSLAISLLNHTNIQPSK